MIKNAGNAQNGERVGNKCLRLDMDGDTLNVQQQQAKTNKKMSTTTTQNNRKKYHLQA